MRSFIFALFVLFSSLSLVSSLACPSGQAWECTSVATDYNYAACVNNVCACFPGEDMQGSASISDLCRCTAPEVPTWDGAHVYCVLPPHLQAAADIQTKQVAANHAFFHACINSLYTDNQGDNGDLVLAGVIDLSGCLLDNVTIRVNDVGVYENSLLMQEYFFGLLGNTVSRLAQIVCQGYVCMSRDIISFSVTPTPPNGRSNYNLTEVAEWYFDPPTNKLKLADMVINDVGDENYPIRTQNDQVVQLCSTLPYICPKASFMDKFDSNGINIGKNLYNDYNDCYDFMSQITFGTWIGESGDWELGNAPKVGLHRGASSNTTLCRVVHEKLAYIRPDIHCQHTGKANTVKCEDLPSTDYYQGTFAQQLDAEARANQNAP